MALRFRLDNGLTVVFQEQHQAKVAAFQVWVKAGSADEREDQAGLAHLHEHMLFKGTSKRGPGEIAHAIESHGGEINAWTSFDQTVYHVVMASQYARVGLEVLSDAVRNSRFDPEELSREIEVVCEEIKRGQDLPSRRASQALFSAAYQLHPYRRPVIGWEKTVRSFTQDKVLEFYRQHYAPKNMVLSAAGDLTESELREWSEELLGGSWGIPSSSSSTRPAEPLPAWRRFQLVQDPSKDVWLNVAFPACALSHEDTAALDLLSLIVGQGDSSRLSLEVKRKGGWVNDVHTFAYTPKDPGLFTLSLTTQPQKLEQALLESLHTLMAVAHFPVSTQELETVKALVEADSIYQRETVQGLSRKLGFYESSGGLEEEAQYFQRVSSATPEKLLEVARRYLDPSRATVTGLLPTGTAFSESQANAILNQVAEGPARPPAPKKFASLAALSSSRRAEGPPRTGRAAEVVVEKLSSGARVLIRPEHSVPLFALRAAFLGGTRYETEADNGLNVLLSRVLPRGTDQYDAEQVSHLVDQLAGSLAAATGRNSFSLRGEFLSKHFHRAFELFADVLLRPQFPDKELTRERDLLLQDVASRDDQPSAVAFDLFHKTLYLQHPYRLHIGGERSSLESLGRADLVRFHQQYLDPSQLTLAVVGDVQVDQVLALAEEAFGRSRGFAKAPPTVAGESPFTSPRMARRTLERAQAQVVYGFPGVRLSDPTRRSLEVLSTLLSGQGGRLFLELRDKRSLAYSVTSYSVEGLDPGYFAIYIGSSPEKVPAALKGIRQELERIRNEPVSEAELVRARRHLIGGHEIGLQRNGARAALMALEHCYDLPLPDVFHYAEQVEAVTPEGVLQAAQQVINFERSALAVVGPASMRLEDAS